MKQSRPRAGRAPQRDGSREEFWRETIRRFAGSGRSVRAFCESQGLSEPSFYLWRRILAERDAASASMSRSTSTPAFVPVHVAEERSERIEIVLRGDRRIRLYGPVDRAALADVLAALESVR